MIFLSAALLIVLSILFVFLSYLVLGIFVGAPYVGTSHARIEKIIKLANIKRGDRVVDLGSGDGRIVIAMAKKGAIAFGYEINPIYVLIAKLKIYREGLSKNAFIYWKNFWSVDLSKFDVIVIYGVSYIMEKLEKKLKKQVKSTAKIISLSYTFKDWRPLLQDAHVFVYKKH